MKGIQFRKQRVQGRKKRSWVYARQLRDLSSAIYQVTQLAFDTYVSFILHDTLLPSIVKRLIKNRCRQVTYIAYIGLPRLYPCNNHNAPT